MRHVHEFVDRLRQRKIVQWALAYAAGAFALIQVVDIVAQRFGWPEQAVRLIIIALAVGFFVTLVLAWYHGERGAQRVTGTELSILALLLAIGGGLLWRIAPGGNEPEQHATAPAPASAVTAPLESKSIAVLPFENLSDDKANAYFAEGMQDEILTRLAKVGALKVISRTSTMQYASKPGNLSEIARQLGVTNILEGSVQKAANRVRINVQLIRAEGDNHLWAETYDRTLDDIFGVQGEVAGAIADKLGTQLSGNARQEVTAAPTRNAAAYDAYLRGLTLYRQGFRTASFTASTQAFREAVAADPDFAQAWALLARGQATEIFFGQASPQSRAAALHALETAERLQPDSLETKAARAYYVYRVQENYDEARQRFDALRQRWPNDSELLTVSSYLLSRQGNEIESNARVVEALKLDPLNIQLHKLQVVDAIYQRRFDDAFKAIERVQAIAPGDSESMRMKAQIYLAQGDLASAALVLDKFPATNSEDSAAYVQLARLQRAYRPAITRIQEFVDHPDPSGSEIDLIDSRLNVADFQRLAGDRAAAETNYRLVRERLGTLLADQQDNFLMLGELLTAEAGLGNEKAAFAAVDRLLQLSPESKDVLKGRGVLENRARLLARFGHKDEAIAGLRYLLSRNYLGSSYAPVTIALLKLDPDFDGLRDQPGYTALIDAPAVGAGAAAHQ
jgi:TolB-like protein/Tfp pilus assembly protein PilF